MKKSIYYLLVFSFVLSLNSCEDKYCSCSEEINGTWEVEQFMSIESVLYAKNNNYSPSVEFKTDGSFEIHLDINVCSGRFELSEESGITFSAIGCTEACCDSDFSEKFIEMLPQVSDYEIDGKDLKLNVPGWGWIELTRISN